MVNVILLCPVTTTVVCVFTPHKYGMPQCSGYGGWGWKVTHVNYTLFPTAPRILGRLTTDFALSGQK